MTGTAKKPRRILSSKSKLTSRTLPAIVKRLKRFRDYAAIDHGRQFAQYRMTGKLHSQKTAVEHIIPIMVLYFTDRPVAEQLAIYDRYAAICERLVHEWQFAERESTSDDDLPEAGPTGLIPPSSVTRKPGPKRKG